MYNLSREDRELFVDNLDNARNRELLVVAWWGLFKPHKTRELIDRLKDGMVWRFAYNSAKNKKK